MIVAYGVSSFLISFIIYWLCRFLGFKGLYANFKDSVLSKPHIPIGVYIKSFFVMCIEAPLIEEAIFRLLLFRIGFWFTPSIVAVVLITSILFALMHATSWPSFPLPQLTGGIIMGMAYLMGGFWAAAGVHVTHNFCVALWIVINRAWIKLSGY